ncbi:hypothetical protein K8Z61_12325 [Nocardioides sp. TRM66260-LWL]|uniref:hypothetical protein n=1 Tax=Nocardioides sp. TRM66260-LWL TaxID=2874478 RepID=UPI001CC4B48E|nr:hypothetical protein [Nocardioides sp. TRM66260-LWL]MBZ5735281.1 hypothetical protein [Nocardioides sp. TRM66260-LWL]
MPAPRARVAALCVTVVSTLLGPAAAPPASGADDPFAATEVRLPAVPDGTTIRSVRLDGDTAYAVVADTGSNTSSGRVLVAPSDGSGPWQDLLDPATAQPVRGGAVEVGRGVAVVGSGDSYLCDDYVILGEARSGRFRSCGRPTVGREGAFVVATGFGDPHSGIGYEPWELRRISDGSLVEELDYDQDSQRDFSVDGDLVWWFHGQQSELRSLDVRTGEGRSWPLPLACRFNATLREVVDGVVHLRCAGTAAAVDTRRGLPARVEPQLDDVGRVGIAWPDALSSPSVTVHDLGSAARSWVITGWYGGRYLWEDVDRPPTVAADVADRPAVIVATSPSTASVWTFSTSAPIETTTDVTAPTVRFTRTPRPLIAGARRDPTLRWSWAVSDDQTAGALESISSYGLGYVGEPMQWSSPYSSTRRHTFELTLRGPERRCLRVRARDWAGNLGPWAVSCVVVDAGAPLAEFSAPEMGIGLVKRRGPLRLGFVVRPSGSGQGITSYDIGRRIALPGRVLSPWRVPARWRGVRGGEHAIRLTPGSQVCLRVRARDRAGNVGGWDPNRPRCGAVPYDETTLRIDGPHHRVRTTGKAIDPIGSTSTTIDRRSRIHLGRITARRLIVLMRTTPYTCFRVEVGGRRVAAHCSYGDDGDLSGTQVRVHLNRAVTGDVIIRPIGNGPGQLLLDGVAVER